MSAGDDHLRRQEFVRLGKPSDDDHLRVDRRKLSNRRVPTSSAS